MGGCKKLMLFLCGGFSFVRGKRTRDFAFVSLCYGRSGEEMCTGYMPWPPAAECNMITNKQTCHNQPLVRGPLLTVIEVL